MTQSDTRSLDEIRRETERSRAGLTLTVEELRATVTGTASDIRQRISPEAIKAEVGGYFRSRGEQLMEAARHNPMQAIAVGVSMAYPVLRIVRSIPAPVLMIGAGLYLAGSKTGQSVAEGASHATSDLAAAAGRRVQDMRSHVDERVAAAKDYITGVADALGVGEDAASSSGSDSSTIVEARRLAMGGESTISPSDRQDATAAVSSMPVTDYGDDKSMVGAARSAMETVRQRTADISDQAGKTFRQTAEQNPLLVGGIGLLVGGMLASVLPQSRVEEKLVGDAGKRMKSGVRERFADEDIDDDTRDLGHRVRKVAEAAVTTAFEMPSEEHHQQGDGGPRHG